MVTIDNRIQNVGEFKGDLGVEKRKYEQAKQGVEIIEAEMSALEQSLKDVTGFDEVFLPVTPTHTPIVLGEVAFDVKSERRTKRPQYKTAVCEMENYLVGIAYLLLEGRTITGVAKVEGQPFIRADKLLEMYDTIVAAVLVPEIKHTIKYESRGILAQEGVPRVINLREDRDIGALTAENAVDYIRMDKLKPILAEFIDAYQKQLTLGQSADERVTVVDSKSAYKTKKATTNGTDWAHVAMTLVTIPTRQQYVGEVNLLSDENIPLEMKRALMPKYEIVERTPFGESKTYISVRSVYHRIQELKLDKTIQTQRIEVKPLQVV